MQLKKDFLLVFAMTLMVMIAFSATAYSAPAGWTVGDYLGSPLITTDNDIQWLSPTATQGISYNDIMTALNNPASPIYGFQLADNTQIGSLFNSYGIAIAYTVANLQPARDFLADFGTTAQETNSRYVQGIGSTIGTESDRVRAPLVSEVYSTGRGYASLTDSQMTMGYTIPEIGAWLYRSAPAQPVPLPGSVWFIIFGLLGLRVLNKKK